MKIENGVLLSVTAEDINSDGVLRIPSGVKDIAEGVGNDLPTLKELHLPETMKQLDKKVFCSNPSLVIVDLGPGISYMSLFAFENCLNIKKVYTTNHNERNLQWAECACPYLESIVIYQRNGGKRHYPVYVHFGNLFYPISSKTVGTITVTQQAYLEKLADKTNQQADVFTVSKRGEQDIFVDPNLRIAVTKFRNHELTQEFERHIRKYNILNNVDEKTEELEEILRRALSTNLNSYHFNSTPKNRGIIRQHIQNTEKYMDYIKQFAQKYSNTDGHLAELFGVDFDGLAEIITPVDTANTPQVNKSCTRWLKRHPVTQLEMNSIVCTGHKNPGSFPYSWLAKIPEIDRSHATQKLHQIFKRATISMYSPDQEERQEDLHLDILQKMSQEISQVISQPVQIKYLGSGKFSKTYTVQIPGDKKYVWKIYHCTIDNRFQEAYHHDTEIQNSFLMGGRKYCGKTKFRQISTAGISNQRGETYMIYPYTDEEYVFQYPQKPFKQVDMYKLIDGNYKNIMGNTLIDMGGIEINFARWYQPRYVSKIINTVLYQSWNDLGYVLNKYTSSQIKMAISFMDDRISSNSLKYNTIQAKIEYLKRGAKIR